MNENPELSSSDEFRYYDFIGFIYYDLFASGLYILNFLPANLNALKNKIDLNALYTSLRIQISRMMGKCCTCYKNLEKHIHNRIWQNAELEFYA